MSRRRRKDGNSDSLDLLLDALCNMFGGIIFIALLIVIQVSESAEESNIQKDGKIEAVSDAVQTVRVQIELLEEQLRKLLQDNPEQRQRIEEQLELLEETRIQKNKAADASERNANRGLEEDQAEEDARGELARLEELIESLQEQLEENDTTKIADAITEEEHSIKEIESQIETLTRRRVLDARLPRERESGVAYAVWIILEGNRAYVTIGSNRGLRSFDARDVSAVPTSDGCWKYTPIQNGGFVVTKNISRHPRFVEFINSFRNTNYVVSMTIRSNSHEAFQFFRAALINKGFSYNVTTYDDSFLLCIGETDTSEQ